jgi:hypothetical protein
MRSEQQPITKIRILAELVAAGTGITGKTVTATLRRLSDDQYLQSGGGWGASPSTLTLTERSSANQPGLYAYEVSSADVSMSHVGYEAIVVQSADTSYPMRECVMIWPYVDAAQPIDPDAVVAGSMADLIFRIAGLAGRYNRITWSTFDPTSNNPLTGTIKLYETGADADADTNVKGEYSFTAGYDGQDRATSYVGKQTS